MPEIIKTKAVRGKGAIAAARSAYRQFSRQRTQHPSNVMRLPGLLSVNTKLDKAIDRVNEKKTELKDLMKFDYPNARTRNSYCKKHFPGRMMLQVYRHTHYAKRPVKRAVFRWEPFTRSTKVLTKSEALDRLNKQPRYAIKYGEDNKTKAIEIALQQIDRAPQKTEYAIVKPRAPHPKLVLYFSDDNNDMCTVPANLPVVIPHTNKIEISDLSDLVTISNKRSTRSNQFKIESVYMPLNLYQIIE